jgi:hypothetical protein
MRISNEVLDTYNPVFYNLDYNFVDKSTRSNNNKQITNDDQYKAIIIFLNSLKKNKIYIELKNLLTKYKLNINLDSYIKNSINSYSPTNINRYKKEDIEGIESSNPIKQIKKEIKEKDIPFKKKEELLNLLKHIENIIFIDTLKNDKYIDYTQLARDVLVEDLELEKNENTDIKNKLNKISTDFINLLYTNLRISEENHNKNNIVKDKTLFGYHNNIILFNIFPDNVKEFSNEIFRRIIILLSTWLLFAKPIGSAWLMAKYMLINPIDNLRFLRYFNDNTVIWRYFTMGLDNNYFKNIYQNIKNENPNTIGTKALNIFITFLIFLIIAIVLYGYNNSVFNLTSSPSWYSIIYMFIFIIYISGCTFMYPMGKIKSYNIGFIIFLLLIILIIYLIMKFS